MGQITWKNIGATASPAGVGGLMSGAQDSLTRGFGALEKVLEQRQATERANWEQGKENNLNTIMNALHAYEDPDALAGSIQAGKFREMLEGYGAQVDHAAVRSALDTRVGTLQERLVANQNFGDGQYNRGLQDELVAALSQAAQGDRSGLGGVAGQMRGQAAIDVLTQGTQLYAGEVDRRIGQQNADSSRIGANASMVGAKASALNARTNQERANREGEIHQQQMESLRFRVGAMGEINQLIAGVLKEDMTDINQIDQALEQTRVKLLESGQMTPEEVDGMIAAAYNGIRTGTDLSVLQRGEMLQRVENSWARYGGNRNPFLLEPRSTDPFNDINAIFDSFQDSELRAFGISSAKKRNEATADAFGMATTGFTVTRRGEGQAPREVDVVMPPGFIKLLAQGIRGDGNFMVFNWRSNRSFAQNAKLFLEENPALIDAMESANGFWKEEEQIAEMYRALQSPVGQAANYAPR